MATSTLHGIRSGHETVIDGAEYSVVLSTRAADIEAAQRLRYRVFSTEPGFASSMARVADGRDADRFDEHCDHLLVRHRASGEVVGCYRMLPPPGAIAAGGLYLATEFALGELDAIRPQTVEMGRACVAPEHRNGAVLALMWAGILAYAERRGLRYVVGAVSVPMAAPGLERGAVVRAACELVDARPPAPWRVEPYLPVSGIDDVPPAGRRALPPLLVGYLRMNAEVLGPPAYDAVFDVADLPTILDRERADVRYLARLRRAAA